MEGPSDAGSIPASSIIFIEKKLLFHEETAVFFVWKSVVRRSLFP